MMTLHCLQINGSVIWGTLFLHLIEQKYIFPLTNCRWLATCKKHVLRFLLGCIDVWPLHKMFPLTSSLCWRCRNHVDTILHIWGECDWIGPYWALIFDTYVEVTSEAPPYPPVGVADRQPRSPINLQNNILRFFLIAAWAWIPRFWKTRNVPTGVEWILEKEHHLRMEELTARLND